MLNFDDQFPIHRKLSGLSDAGFRLHVEAIFWCARHLTDGVVGQHELDTVSVRLRRPIDLVPSLEGRDAWHRFEDGRMTAPCKECEERYGGTLRGNGWVIHGYLDWQQTRSKVLQTREAKRKAGSIGGKKSASVRAARYGTAKPAAQDKGGKQNASRRRSTTAQFAQPPFPSPSKEGKRGERAAPLGAPLAPSPGSGKGVTGSPIVFDEAVLADPEKRKQRMDQVRSQIRKPRHDPRRSPFDPLPDKAQGALDALDEALEKLTPQPEEVPDDPA